MSKIKEQRLKKKISQAELAKKAGVSEISIRKYESGERSPKLDKLLRIATALDISVRDLLEENEPYSPDTVDSLEQIQKNIVLLEDYAQKFFDFLESFEYTATKDAEETIANSLGLSMDRVDEMKEDALIAYYRHLNARGQYEAIKYVKCLSYNQAYQKSYQTSFEELAQAPAELLPTEGQPPAGADPHQDNNQDNE